MHIVMPVEQSLKYPKWVCILTVTNGIYTLNSGVGSVYLTPTRLN